MRIKAFKGLRPIADKVAQVACRPYDVLDSDEARQEVVGNPYSFLQVVKPEITLPPDMDHYAPEVYQAAAKNFQQMIDEGIFLQDEEECLYLYELIMDGRSQTGIVACAAVDDYMSGSIKKHELTRPDKENDRKNHVRVSMMNAEPVFFAYKAVKHLDEMVKKITGADQPEYDFKSADGIRHRLWKIANETTIREIVLAFERMPATYVADGHHRTAAAALVGHELKNENPGHHGNEEYNYFLAVHFPDNQLQIIDYNRVVKDLNGLTPEEFLKKLSGSFSITDHGTTPYKPSRLHELSMYLEGKWYALKAADGTYNDNDPIETLDVTLLSEHILRPILNIHDLRTDKRIDFVGGIRGLGELKKRVDSGEMAVAFALFPVSMQQLTTIADKGMIMPPKTTWFEPKLRSGLVVHSLRN